MRFLGSQRKYDRLHCRLVHIGNVRIVRTNCHLALQELSTDIRFPDLGSEKRNVQNTSGSLVGRYEYRCEG